jgi:hypothetical protein
MSGKKQYRVRTRHEPWLWLRALDPLEIGRASFVRSEWREKKDEGTVFPSNMYADEVARNAPIKWPYVVVKPDQ